MQLPELNTSGIDVTNTLAKIEAMKLNRLQQQNLQNEMDARNAQVGSTNAFRIMQTKKAKQEMEAAQAEQGYKQMDEVARSTAYIAGLPEEIQEAAWEDLRSTYTEKGIKSIAPGSAFKVNGVWNSDKFRTMAQSGIRARKLELDPEVGKAEYLEVANPEFDSTKPESPTNPALIKRRYISQGFGKLTVDDTVKSTPVKNFYREQDLEDKKLEATTAHTAAIEKQTAQRNKELAEWRKGMLKVALMNANTNKEKAGKLTVKQTLKNPDGLDIHIMTDGKGYTTAMDAEGNPTLVLATPEQMKGLTGVGYPETAVDELIRKTQEAQGGNSPAPTSAPSPTAKGTKDEFGYILGETRPATKGKYAGQSVKYIGNNQWELVKSGI